MDCEKPIQQKEARGKGECLILRRSPRDSDVGSRLKGRRGGPFQESLHSDRMGTTLPAARLGSVSVARKPAAMQIALATSR